MQDKDIGQLVENYRRAMRDGELQAAYEIVVKYL